MQHFTQCGCTHILCSCICEEGACREEGHLRRVTELLVDIPHLFLHITAFCAAAAAALRRAGTTCQQGYVYCGGTLGENQCVREKERSKSRPVPC